MACQLIEIDSDVRGEKDIEDISRRIAGIRLDGLDMVVPLEQSFGQEKARGQFVVVARGAHGDTHGPGIDPDLERFLDGQSVGSPDKSLPGPPAPQCFMSDLQLADGSRMGRFSSKANARIKIRNPKSEITNLSSLQGFERQAFHPGRSEALWRRGSSPRGS